MIEKYVIQDTKSKDWLRVDRVANNVDIITVVEHVSSFRAATIFNNESTANKIIEYIKNEGNYDASNFVVDNVEVYFKDEIESNLAQLKEHLKEVVDGDGNHLNQKQIDDELKEAEERIRNSIERQFNH